MSKVLEKSKFLIAATLVVVLFLYVVYPAILLATPNIDSYSSAGSIGGSGNTVSLSLPSGLTSGDLLVACISGNVGAGETAEVSASGWTHVATVGGSSSNKIGMMYRFWQPADSDPVVFTLSSGSASARRGMMWRISGANASPSAATPSTRDQTSGNSDRIYNSITTSEDNSLLLGCLAWNTNDSTYTPDASLSNSVTENRFAGDYRVQASAGASGSFTGSGTSATYKSILWAVAPGAGPNTAPSVVANSPADSATGISTTPTLNFTGSDDDDDDLTYEIQITDNPDAYTGGEILVDSYSGIGGTPFVIHPNPLSSVTSPTTGNIQTDDRACQSFTGNGGRITRASFYFGVNETSPSSTDGTLYARIYNIDGTHGTNARPAGATAAPSGSATNEGDNTPTTGWLAVSDGLPFDENGETQFHDVTFSGNQIIRTTNGENYMLCADWVPNDTDINNAPAFRATSGNPSGHDGNAWIDGDSANYGDGAADFIDDSDVWFRVYETYILLSKASNADAGFLNTVSGGDTDPFNAGEQISYTVQSGDTLASNAIYYWQVRAKDPSGSDNFSTYSTTRSFTTSSGSSNTKGSSGASTEVNSGAGTPTGGGTSRSGSGGGDGSGGGGPTGGGSSFGKSGGPSP